MSEKMNGLAVETAFGTDCLVVNGDGGSRIAIPISGLQVFFETVEQRVQAHRNRVGDTKALWQQKAVRPITTVQVSEHLTTETQRVFVHLDRGLATELMLTLDHSLAQELAQSLLQTMADARATKTPN